MSSSSKRARIQVLYLSKELSLLLQHILARSPSLHLEFYSTIGSRCGLRTFGIRTDSVGPAIASNSDWRIKHGSVRLLDDNNMPVVIHYDKALVTNHSTELKLFQTLICEKVQSSVAPVSRCRPAGGSIMKTILFARPCAQGRADATRTGHARAF